jgi:LTXXQ motif family protein
MQHRKKLLSLALPLMLSAVVTIGVGIARAESTDAGDQIVAAEDQSQSTQRKHHDPAAYAQSRLEKLKSALSITPEQEPQWSAFADSVMQQMNQMKAAHQQWKDVPATAPERIDRQIAMMKQRTASFEAIGQAAKGLYAALNPDQQHVADEKLLRWHGEHRG